MEELEIIRPDDWHVHFRDDEILKVVVPETTRHFARSIVMPNLIPPILDAMQAIEYKRKIEKAIPSRDNFEPLMTIYLTEKTNKIELKSAYNSGAVFAVKLYPAGATTNSDSGVKNIQKVMPILETMAEIGMPLLIHGEVTDNDIDIFDREKAFIDNKLNFITKELPELKITLEHITTKDAVDFVKNENKNLGASITPQHLALNRNALFVGGIKPHNYCLPVLKREKHRIALVKVATEGDSKFFLGSDSAPHLKTDKESSCGCAGIFSSSNCLSILAQIFENENALPNFEKFVSMNGANHYKLNLNKFKLKLSRSIFPINLKDELFFNKSTIKVFDPNFPIYWKVHDDL